jgi:hypothetical protein
VIDADEAGYLADFLDRDQCACHRARTSRRPAGNAPSLDECI